MCEELMSSPITAPSTVPSPNLALSRGTAIEYKAYARRFQPNIDASVLILVATCYYDTSGFSISFQPAASGYELVEQPPTGVFRNMVTYYVTSWTTGIETDATPGHVTITDSFGQHRVHVTAW
jgi:hypothetical protein